MNNLDETCSSMRLRYVHEILLQSANASIGAFFFACIFCILILCLSYHQIYYFSFVFKKAIIFRLFVFKYENNALSTVCSFFFLITFILEFDNNCFGCCPIILTIKFHYSNIYSAKLFKWNTYKLRTKCFAFLYYASTI